MKSRIVDRSKRLVLSYGVFGESFDTLTAIASRYSIEVRAVMPSQLDSKVSQLLTSQQLPFETYPESTTSSILMCALDNRTTNALLADLKSSTLDIPIKAMLTPSNRSWEYRTLLEHLALEHQRLSAK